MRIIIDLDLHEAITDFGNQSAAPAFVFKSEDTIDFEIYFVEDGVVQDLGAGFTLKFGMVKVGDTTNTILAYQTVITYSTDSQGRKYYLCQVNFNTSQMVTAIGTNASISCTIELRYQTTIGEIIHTLNLPATVYATILQETGVTPPGVSTGYPDASAIELIAHKNNPSGYAGLDSGGHIFTSQLTGVVELVAHKNAASGYAGLDASTKIPVAEIPIDGSTVTITTDNKLQAPFAGGDMKKSVYDTNNDGICDHATLADQATHATNADNAAGLVITTGLGALNSVWGRDAAGGQGLFVSAATRSGGTGLAAIGANTTASFAWPSSGSNVTVNVDDASPFHAIFQDFLVYIGPNFGVLQLVSSNVTSTPNTVTLTNNNQYTVNGNPPGGTIPSGSTIILLSTQVYDADSSNTTGGTTLVTDDTGAGTWLPGIKRLKAADSSIVLDTSNPLAIGIKVGASASPIHAYSYIWTANWTWATGTPIPFDQAYYNVGGMWASGSPTLLTVTTLGAYEIDVQLTAIWGVAPGSTGVFRIMLFYNGSAQAQVDCPTTGFGTGVNSGYQSVRLHTTFKATVTGSFDVRVSSLSGTMPTSLLANVAQSYFKADFIGA